MNAKVVSEAFAVIASLFGLATVGLLIAHQPVYAIPTSILAVGSIITSEIHAKA